LDPDLPLDRWLSLSGRHGNAFYTELLQILLVESGAAGGGVWLFEARGQQRGLSLKAAHRLPFENPAWEGWLRGCVEKLLKGTTGHASFESMAGNPAVGGPFHFLILRDGTVSALLLLVGSPLPAKLAEGLVRRGSAALRWATLAAAARRSSAAHFGEALLESPSELWPSVLATQMGAFLKAARVGVLYEKKQRWRLAAVSGVGEIRRSSTVSRAMEARFLTLLRGAREAKTKEVGIELAPGWGALLEFEDETSRESLEKAWAPIAPVVRKALTQCPVPGLRQKAARALLTASTKPGPRHRRSILAGVAVLLALAALIPVRETFEADCELQPVQRASVVVQVDGRVNSVPVQEGASVKAGDTLAVLDTSALSTRLEGVRQQRQEQEARARRFQSQQDLTAYRLSILRAEQAAQEETRLKEDLRAATVTAPIDGRILSKDLSQKQGVLMRAGDLLCELGGLDRWSLQIALPEQEVASLLVALGQQGSLPVSYRLKAGAEVELSAKLTDPRQIGQMAYSASGRNVVYLTVDSVEIPEALRNDLRPGFSGRARVEGLRRPWGRILTRRLADYLHLRWWL
jgi:multidrug efflux pump subunit AcrA (membrane-fusion protein)